MAMLEYRFTLIDIVFN